MEEKHNGIWITVKRDNEGQIVFEEYLPKSDKIHVIFKREDGHFQPCSYVKKNDHQWKLPIWSAENSKAVLPTIQSAKEYLSAYV